MKARVATRLTLWLSAGVIAGALAADPYTPPTPDAFLRGIKSYPYAAPAARRDRIRAGVRSSPDACPGRKSASSWATLTSASSRTAAAPATRSPPGELFTYILEKPAATEAVQGSRVVLWLGNDFKLQAITIHGAPGLETNISRRNQACTTP